jgi:hypothetical protein
MCGQLTFARIGATDAAHEDVRQSPMISGFGHRLGRHCEERQRRSNPFCLRGAVDCFASLAMTIQPHRSV